MSRSRGDSREKSDNGYLPRSSRSRNGGSSRLALSYQNDIGKAQQLVRETNTHFNR